MTSEQRDSCLDVFVKVQSPTTSELRLTRVAQSSSRLKESAEGQNDCRGALAHVKGLDGLDTPAVECQVNRGLENHRR